MPNVSVGLLAMFAGSVIFQLIGVTLLPLTKGLTQALPTSGAAICFLLGIGLMARLTHSGVNISVLLPFIATVVPLCSVAIGVLVYGDGASWARIGMLVAACITTGLATYF